MPGLGRGATGFTTRSDIGPARPGVVGQVHLSIGRLAFTTTRDVVLRIPL